MTNEEKNLIFETIETKKTCRRAFKEINDNDTVERYTSEITGILCVISKLNLFDDYFEYMERGSK